MTAAPTSTVTERDAALLAAYTAHVTETGRRPSVRALRERARTSTGAAATWLKTCAPERRAPEIPAEQLSPVLAPLWAAAVEAATQALQDDHQAALDEHIESEALALEMTEQALTEAHQQAIAAEARADELVQALSALQEEIPLVRQLVHAAEQSAAAERERAHAAIHEAEQAAAVARAEAQTLREALAAVRPATDTTQETP